MPSDANGSTRPRADAAKKPLIALLVGVNLLLAAALLVQTTSLPAAYAQAGLRGGDFACVAAKPLGQTFEVIYVLDATGRKLYGFYPTDVQARQFAHAAPRDLSADFGRQRSP